MLDGSIVLILMLGASFFLGRIYLGPLLRRKNAAESETGSGCEGSAGCGCSRTHGRKYFVGTGKTAGGGVDKMYITAGERRQ